MSTVSLLGSVNLQSQHSSRVGMGIPCAVSCGCPSFWLGSHMAQLVRSSVAGHLTHQELLRPDNSQHLCLELRLLTLPHTYVYVEQK